MREFSILGFVEHLAVIGAEIVVAEHEALVKSAEIIETEAKRSLGEYQEESGPIAAWAELADATKADRVQQGYPENDPELRSGALRDSIEKTIGSNEADIGSDSPIMEYQELGTAKMPPRSIMGGAAARRADEVAQVIGDEFVAVLIGGSAPLRIR